MFTTQAIEERLRAMRKAQIRVTAEFRDREREARVLSGCLRDIADELEAEAGQRGPEAPARLAAWLRGEVDALTGKYLAECDEQLGGTRDALKEAQLAYSRAVADRYRELSG